MTCDCWIFSAGGVLVDSMSQKRLNASQGAGCKSFWKLTSMQKKKSWEITFLLPRCVADFVSLSFFFAKIDHMQVVKTTSAFVKVLMAGLTVRLEGTESPTHCGRIGPRDSSRCPPWWWGRRWHCWARRWAGQLPSRTPAGWGRLERCGFPPHCSPTAGRKRRGEHTQQTQTSKQGAQHAAPH